MWASADKLDVLMVTSSLLLLTNAIIMVGSKNEKMQKLSCYIYLLCTDSPPHTITSFDPTGAPFCAYPLCIGHTPPQWTAAHFCMCRTFGGLTSWTGTWGKCVHPQHQNCMKSTHSDYFMEKLAHHASPPTLYFHMPLLKILVSAYSHQNYAVQIRHYFSC